jgi:hypothetical protein
MRVAKGYLYYKAGPDTQLLGLFGRVEANPGQPGHLMIVFDRLANQLGAHEEVEARELDPVNHKEEWQFVYPAADRAVNSAPRGVIETREPSTFGPQERFIGGLPPHPHNGQGVFWCPLTTWESVDDMGQPVHEPFVQVYLGWVPR